MVDYTLYSIDPSGIQKETPVSAIYPLGSWEKGS